MMFSLNHSLQTCSTIFLTDWFYLDFFHGLWTRTWTGVCFSFFCYIFLFSVTCTRLGCPHSFHVVKLFVYCIVTRDNTLHAVCCGDNVGIRDHAGAADMIPSATHPELQATLPRPWVRSGFHAADDTCLGRRCSRSDDRLATEAWRDGRLRLVIYIGTDRNRLYSRQRHFKVIKYWEFVIYWSVIFYRAFACHNILFCSGVYR